MLHIHRVYNKTYYNIDDKYELPPRKDYIRRDIIGNGRFNNGKRPELFSTHAKELPAPDKYQNYVFQRRTLSHGVISEARPKCELDWALIRSTKVPGPGYYGDLNPFGTDIPGNGKINDAKPKDYLEQAIFDNKHAPGPGKYPVKQFGGGIKGGKLSTAMPKTDVEWKMYFASQTPAPHDYKIPYNLGKTFQGGKFSLDKRPSPLKNKNTANEPGPSDYQNVHSLSYSNKNSNKGAIFSTANPPSSVDLLIRRSGQIPAPHDYYNKNQDFGQNIEGGKISKAKVPSEIAKQIRLASEIPGVGEYDVRKYEQTSTKTLDFGKTEDRWPDKNRFHYYQPNPGPGEYISNASSMGYQVESQYSTAPSSMLLRKHEIIDSRSKYNTGPGKYEYVDSFGIQVTSGKKTNPIVAFGKGEGHQHRSPPIDTIVPHATRYEGMKALDKLLKKTIVTGENANYKARLRNARVNRWKWRSKHNF